MSALSQCTVPLLWNANGFVEVIKEDDICPVEASRVIKLIEYFSCDESEGMYSPCSMSSNDVSDTDTNEKSRSEDERYINYQQANDISTRIGLSNQINAVEVECKLLELQHTQQSTNQLRSMKDEKVHVCELCGKCFSRKFNLNTHIKCVHSKEKDYLCTYCQRAFNHSSNLRKHIKTVHGLEKRIPCSICCKLFKHTDALNNHLKVIHGWYKFEH